MADAHFKLPRGMDAEHTAKTLAIYLAGLGALTDMINDVPYRKDDLGDEERWTLDPANDHWLHAKPDGQARIVSRYPESRTPALLRDLLLDRHGDAAEAARAA